MNDIWNNDTEEYKENNNDLSQEKTNIDQGADAAGHEGSAETSGAAGQEVSGASDQKISGVSDQEVSGASDQKVSGASDQEVSGVSDQKVSETSDLELSGAAAADEAANEKISESEPAEQTAATTYSWVNPKLKNNGNSSGPGKNVWDTESGSENYWSEKIYSTTGSESGSGQNDNGYGSGYSNGASGEAGETASPGTGYTYSQSTGAKHTDPVHSDQAEKDPKKHRKDKRNKPVKNHEGRSGRSAWARLIAMALVFGLIAGSVSYCVNRAANAVFGSGNTKENSSRQIGSTANASGNDSNAEEGEIPTANVDGSDSVSTDAGTVADVAQNCMPALVTISTMSVQEMQSFFGGTQSYEVEGAGTGIIISQTEDELLIATNNHVVQGAKELSVGFIDETAVTAAVKGTDADNDLAIVAVKMADITEDTMNKIKVIAIGDSDSLVLGEQVVAIGNALGLGQSVTSGYVSAFDRSLELSDGTSTFTSSGLIQTDASINSGNSGGALLNMKGELIGINEAKSSGSTTGASVDNVGYSIPTSKAMPILETLMDMETREVLSEDQQGYLGIHCVDVSEESSQMYNIPIGVYVSDVVKGGPAESAGLKQGDVITAINSISTGSYTALTNELKYYAAGSQVTLTIQRSGENGYEEMSVDLTLGSKDVIEDSSTEENAGDSSGTGEILPEQEQEQSRGGNGWDWFFGD